MSGAEELLAWVWANTQKLRDLAVLLSAVAAVIGAPVAYLKIRAYRSVRQELIAKDLYKSYTLLAVQHSDLAYPASRQVNYKDCTFDNSTDKFQQYEWFFSYLLMTASEILNLEVKGKKNWRDLIRLQIWYHKEYLEAFSDDDKLYLRHQPKNVRSLVADVRGDSRSPTPGQQQVRPQ